ncbi:MAG: peroxiredoxin [Rhodanobacter sp.]
MLVTTSASPGAPTIGKKVPSLTGLTGDGSELKLASLRGQWVVLYFYPKDSTPGCTTEAKDFRDLHAQFAARNAQVIGVSRDTVASHARFAEKQQLPFPLIADTEQTWCQKFDVIHEKVLYGKHQMGVVRSTFLIDPDGKLVQEWRAVKVAGHAQAVLDAITA